MRSSIACSMCIRILLNFDTPLPWVLPKCLWERDDLDSFWGSARGYLRVLVPLADIASFTGLQYWLMQPVYMNILQIHAFCNTHDISWGTKNLDKNGQGQGSDYKHTFRKGHLNSAQQKKESKAFWDARLKVSSLCQSIL